MAVRNPTIESRAFPNCVTITWAGLLQSSSDTGAPVQYPHFNDKTVQLVGTLGVGGAVQIKGSNDGVTYALLTDPQGNAITLSAIGAIEAITECPLFLRPEVSGGDGTTDLSVIIQATKGTR